MKHTLAALATLFIMAGVLYLGARRADLPRLGAKDDLAGPTDVANSSLRPAAERVSELLSSARAGDVASYLGSFGGPLRARLEREAEERGRAAFGRDLRRAAAARKSHAVFAAEPDSAAGDSVRVTVEAVFKDRLERHTYRLERAATDWLVTEVAVTHEIVPRIALGSVASYQEPEGVPVATVADDGQASGPPQ
jgi:hypothetical protein